MMKKQYIMPCIKVKETGLSLLRGEAYSEQTGDPSQFNSKQNTFEEEDINSNVWDSEW